MSLFAQVTNSPFLPSIINSDPLSIAITSSHKDIVTLLLEQTGVDIIFVDPDTGNSYIHLACQKTEDVQILESLLKKLRLVLKKEEIVAFLALENKDQFTAIDFCSSK